MKKIIVLVSAIMLLTVAPLLAVIGPIPVDESNDLVDGKIYGWITITQIDSSCVEIKADANQAILIPVDNFGVQAFGFNYAGSGCLSSTLPAGWIETTGNLDGFGVFIQNEDGSGGDRQDPLVIKVCNECGFLTEAEVVVPNTLGYTFAMHIADFSGNECSQNPDDCSSAFFATKKTTEIELASFTAVPGNSVTLTWITETETDTAGFNILRADKKNGVYEQINEALIPSEGSATQGASYEFVDNDVQKGKKYFYKLEDIDIDQTSTLHGPVKVKVKVKKK